MAQKKIVIYARDWCSYRWRAKRLLTHKGYDFEVIDASGNHEIKAFGCSGGLDLLVRSG